jgi:hypothetical protein
MTALVWANVLLAVPFLAAFIGIPLWMTFRRPDTGADHSQAHGYLEAKAALAGAGAAPAPSTAGAGRRPKGMAALRRRAVTARRDHARRAVRHAGVSA